MQLVLSTFPGIDLLGEAFKLEGFSVVQSGDPIFGGDIRREHWPSGRFDGVIGGPPCQAFSRLAPLIRHNGYQPKFGNLIPDFERAVRECEPQWFLMENVPDAPTPCVAGYDSYSYILNNRQCIDEQGKPAVQNRVRRWTWGWRGDDRPPLLIDVVTFESREYEYAACGGSSGSSLGALGWDGGPGKKTTRRNPGVVVALGGSGKPKGTHFARLCRLQGLPGDFLKEAPLTVAGKCKAVGNGVPLPMGRAIAKAVREATE